MSSPDILALLSHIPYEWRGLFTSLFGQDRQLAHAEAWFSGEKGSRLGQSPLWSALIDSLSEEEPFVGLEDLEFTPRILHFPVHIQRLILTFVHHHRQEIPSSSIKQLLDALKYHPSPDSWVSTLTCLLKNHVSYLSLTDTMGCCDKITPSSDKCGPESYEHTYNFTQENSSQADILLSQLKELQGFGSGNVKRFISSPWNGYTNRACTENMEKTETCQKDDEANGHESSLETSHQPSFIDEDTPELSLCDDTPKVLKASSLGETAPKKRRISSSIVEAADSCNLSQSSSVSASHDQECQIMLQARRLGEIWMTSDQNSSTDMPEELKLLTSCSSAQMEVVCQQLQLSQLPETAAITACQHVARLSQELSHVNCVIFSRACILPKVVNLSQNASRAFLGAMLNFCQVYPKCTAEGVLIPCLSSGNIETPQVDLLSRIIREAFSVENRMSFVRDLFSKENELKWTETSVAIIQLLLEMKVTMDAADIDNLIHSMEGSALSLADSLKYGKIILAVITKYGKQLSLANAAGLRQILEVHRTFLKKSALSALNRLKL